MRESERIRVSLKIHKVLLIFIIGPFSTIVHFTLSEEDNDDLDDDSWRWYSTFARREKPQSTFTQNGPAAAAGKYPASTTVY